MMPLQPSKMMVCIAVKSPCVSSLDLWHFNINYLLFEWTDIFFLIYFFLLVVLDGAETLEKSEVQAIIESTPELDMDLDGCRGTR